MWSPLNILKRSHGALAVNHVHDRGMSWGEAVALGLIPGCSRIAMLGHNPNTTVGDSITIAGGAYPWKTTASGLEVLSSSANDTLAGTGMQKLTVITLDSSFNQHVEVVSLNGTTPVALTAAGTTYFRVQQALNNQAGSLGANAGTITIRDAGGGTTRAQIEVLPSGVGRGFLDQTAYTVPTGFTLEVISLTISINKGGQTTDFSVTNWVRNNTTHAILQPLQIATNASTYRHEVSGGYPLFTVSGTSDLDFIVQTQSGALDVTVAWFGTLVQNSTVLAL